MSPRDLDSELIHITRGIRAVFAATKNRLEQKYLIDEVADLAKELFVEWAKAEK